VSERGTIDLDLLLIGWEGGVKLMSQSLSVSKQNYQSKSVVFGDSSPATIGRLFVANITRTLISQY